MSPSNEAVTMSPLHFYFSNQEILRCHYARLTCFKAWPICGWSSSTWLEAPKSKLEKQVHTQHAGTQWLHLLRQRQRGGQVFCQCCHLLPSERKQRVYVGQAEDVTTLLFFKPFWRPDTPTKEAHLPLKCLFFWPSTTMDLVGHDASNTSLPLSLVSSKHETQKEKEQSQYIGSPPSQRQWHRLRGTTNNLSPLAAHPNPI